MRLIILMIFLSFQSCNLVGETGVSDDFFEFKENSLHYAQAPETRFISVWRTTTPSESVTLPLRAGFNYDFTVDWGDGSPLTPVVSDSDSNKTHIYTTAGDYTATITGTLEAWYFNNAGDKLKIISIISLGHMGRINFEKAFYGSANMTSLEDGNTAAVTNMSSMFYNTTSLTSLDATGWADVTGVTGTSAFTSTNALLSVTCDQGGMPATGSLFTEPCL